jgi:hypothetical protein
MTVMPAAGSPGLPMGGMMPGGAPVDPSSVILQLLQEIMGKWQGTQMQVAGEQGALIDAMSQLAMAPPPATAQQGMVEGGGTGNFGVGQPAMGPAQPAAGPGGY